MLKPQDVMVLLKLLSNLKGNQWPEKWSQNQLAVHLCMSPSEVNAGIKRLQKSGLLRQMRLKTAPLKAKQLVTTHRYSYLPIDKASEEFLIYGVKYVFPAQLGEYTRGIATSYAAPIFAGKILLGKDPIPVWPYEEGTERGLELGPLYSSVPKSLVQYPDQIFMIY